MRKQEDDAQNVVDAIAYTNGIYHDYPNMITLILFLIIVHTYSYRHMHNSKISLSTSFFTVVHPLPLCPRLPSHRKRRYTCLSLGWRRKCS